MFRKVVSRSIFGLFLITLACSGSKNTSNQIGPPPLDAVGLVGTDYVLYNELRDNFVSGSIEKDYSADDLIEFLPIYLDYRAKLLDARAAGYYEDMRITDEFELYSKQAAYAYWMDQEIRPTKFQQFKERFDFEVKSKHVLIAVDMNANPNDTAIAYSRIMEARDKYLAGTSIEELDTEYSSTRNGRSMGGDLPWFSVGTTVPEFEEALYSLDVGEISMPVRTQFGYHLIYLEQKRERLPSRQVSHIFVRRNSDPSKLDEAYQRLTEEGNWAETVQNFSEDTPSIQNQGYIGWVNYGSRYDASFIDSVMSIDPALSFTSPIETVYGYHIFKVDSVRSFENEESRDEYIMGLLEESNSFQENNNFVVEYLLDKYNARSFDENITSLQKFIASIDTTDYPEIQIEDSLSILPAFTFSEYEFNVGDYLNYLKSAQSNRNSDIYIASWFDAFKQAKVDENLTPVTLNEFPEFYGQIKNYEDGLVVYQINEDSVWSTSTIDSTLLMQNYRDNIDSYQFEDRHFYYMITSSRDSSLDRAIEYIKAGNSPDSLLSNGFRVGVTSDSTGVFQGEPFTLLSDMELGTISERFEYGGRKAHFYLVDVLPARTMTFNEAFNRLASDYQPVREEKWLKRIRSELNVTSYPETVRVYYEQEDSSE